MPTATRIPNEAEQAEIRKYQQECLTANAGKIIYEESGFQKVDKNPVLVEGGNCFMKNTEKIVDMWNKIPKLQETTVLKILVCNFSGVNNIKHIMIHNKTTNKLIDISGGKTKMVDYEAHKEANKYSVEIDISYVLMRKISSNIADNALRTTNGEKRVRLNKGYLNALKNRAIDRLDFQEAILLQICKYVLETYLNCKKWNNKLDMKYLLSHKFTERVCDNIILY